MSNKKPCTCRRFHLGPCPPDQDTIDGYITNNEYNAILRIFKIRSKDLRAKLRYMAREDGTDKKLGRLLDKRRFFKALRLAIADDILCMEQEAVKASFLKKTRQ